MGQFLASVPHTGLGLFFWWSIYPKPTLSFIGWTWQVGFPAFVPHSLCGTMEMPIVSVCRKVLLILSCINLKHLRRSILPIIDKLIGQNWSESANRNLYWNRHMVCYEGLDFLMVNFLAVYATHRGLGPFSNGQFTSARFRKMKSHALVHVHVNLKLYLHIRKFTCTVCMCTKRKSFRSIPWLFSSFIYILFYLLSTNVPTILNFYVH